MYFYTHANLTKLFMTNKKVTNIFLKDEEK